MPQFDAATYFQDRIGKLNLDKAQSITQAMHDKLAGLQEYQNAVANDQAFLEPDRTVGDVLGDIGTVGVKGAIGLPQATIGIADLLSGGHAGKILAEDLGVRPGDAQKIAADWFSDPQQEANKQVELEDGFVDTLKAAVANPSVIATTIGESPPQMLSGAAVARGLLGFGAKAVGAAAGGVGPALPGLAARTLGEKLAPAIAGAVGEGVLGAGSAAEQLRQEAKDGLLGVKTSLSALGSGVGTALFGFAGAKLSQKVGLPDIDTMLAAGKLSGNPAGFTKAVLGAGVSEGAFEEMRQSMQEQMWQNFAQDKDILAGVGDVAAIGLLSGAAMGGAGGLVSSTAGVAKQSAQATATKKEVQQRPLPPVM